jgi:photosystem II stability/assembly factor-like uncharacterized protein
MQKLKLEIILLSWPLLLLVIVLVSCKSNPKSEALDSGPKKGIQASTEITSFKFNLFNQPAVIYRSTDLGKSWSKFAKGIPEDATLSGIKQYSGKLYVATDYHGVFVKADAKTPWKSLNNGSLKGLDINCIEVEADILIIGTLRNGIFISMDDGQNWKPATRNIEHPIRAFLKSNKELFAGTDKGIFKSTDMGNTWNHVFGEMQILGFTSLNDKLFAAAQNGALMSEDHSEKWKYIYKGDALHDIGRWY